MISSVAMAADPISLSASIITLADTATSVGKFVLETFKTYKFAPEDLLEIAHDINICSTLMVPFGERLQSHAVEYNASFQESVEFLVKNVRDRQADALAP